MNETEARTLRAAADAYVRRMNAKSRAVLAQTYRDDMAELGRVTVFGGPVTRDELLSALVELHYPAAKQNEAIHVIGHQARGWSACNHCHDDDGTHDGHLCQCDRADETACTTCDQQAQFHFSTINTTGRPILLDHGHLGHPYTGTFGRQS
jgi:hypothetical protein